jgi:hypothetical protein
MRFLAKPATIMILHIEYESLLHQTWNVWLTLAAANVESDFIC